MNRRLTRKEFLTLCSVIIGGLSMHGVLGGFAHAGEPESGKGVAADDSYLLKGLNALARAHRMSAMAGHLGASLVAGSFLRKQSPALDDEVYKGIGSDLDRVIRGESVFGAKMTKNSQMADSELFEEFPKEKPSESLIDGIAEALAKNIETLRESGHNVIFASIAIHALKERPEFATPSIVDGIQPRETHPGEALT